MIQHAYLQAGYECLLDFSTPYHTAYAETFKFDYYPYHTKEKYPIRNGGWDRVDLILEAFNCGYQYIVWMDADALIQNDDIDLRKACKDIGACFDLKNPVPHYNVGVLYLENTPEVVEFVKTWMTHYPGRLWHGMFWGEQSDFNLMATENPSLVHTLHNKWNSYAGTPCDAKDIIVKAWHGEQDVFYRLCQMRALKGLV